MNIPSVNTFLSPIKASAMIMVALVIATLTAIFIHAAGPYTVHPHSVRAIFDPTTPGVNMGVSLLRATNDQWHLIGMLLYCTFAMLAGHVFIKQFSKNLCQTPIAHSLMLLAAFMPGYLILVAINRIVTIILPNHIALNCLLLIYSSLLILCVIHQYREWRKVKRLSVKSLGDAILIVLGVVGPLVLFHINQITHPFGDGVFMFFDFIHWANGFKPLEHFPVITGHHYDEIMFLYPIIEINTPDSKGNPEDWYWIMYSFTKAACFSIAILSIQALSNSKVLALLATLLLFFGALHPNPYDWYLLFDSRNPIGESLHTARVFISILPIAIMAIFFRKNNLAAVDNIPSAALLALLSIGLSAVSIHYMLVVVASVGMAACALICPDILAVLFVIGFLMLSTIVLYSSGETITIGSAIFLFALAVCILFLTIVRRATAIPIRETLSDPEKRHFLKKCSITTGIFTLSSAIGLLFLGNSFVSITLKHLPFFHPQFFDFPLLPVPHGFGKYPCDKEGYNSIAKYCENFSSFSKSFALPFIVSGTAAAIAACCRIKRAVDHTDVFMCSALSVALVMLVASFFIYGFMNPAPVDFLGMWVKSRLPEPWFYCCIVLSLVLLWNLSNLPVRALLVISLLCFILIPNLSANNGAYAEIGIFRQLTMNTQFLKDHLFRKAPEQYGPSQSIK